MNIHNFRNNILYILQNNHIENIEINNNKTIKKILFEDNNLIIFFEKFKEYYESLYGKDYSNIFSKIEDMLFNINLIIDYCNNKNYTYSEIKFKIINNNFEIFEACDYSKKDLKRISEEMECCKKEI